MAPELVRGLVQDWAPVWARESVQETVQAKEPVQDSAREMGLAPVRG